MSRAKLFWRGFLLTLLVVVPVYLIYAAVGFSRVKTVDATQTGVPVAQATMQDAANILFAVGGTRTAPARYYLVRLDAWRNKTAVTSFVPQTALYRDGNTTLGDITQAAGIAAAAEALADALQIEIPFYVYAPAETVAAAADSLGCARVKLADYVSEETLRTLRLDIAGTRTAVLPLWQLQQILDSGSIPYASRTQVQALAAGSLLQGGLSALEDALGTLLRTHSEELFTNITAADIISLQHIAGLLARYGPQQWAGALPCILQAGSGQFDAKSHETAQQQFTSADGQTDSAAP